MTRLRRRPLACAWAVALAGACDGAAVTPACAPGATQACACEDGAAGAQVCADDGERWLQCACAGRDGGAPDGIGPPGCVPGATQACVCTDGESGAQACAADGRRWFGCDCSGGARDAGSDGGADGGDAMVLPPAEGFVLIEPGTFVQGGLPENPGGGVSPREVTLTRAFYIQATEVTQAEWEEVMDANPSTFAGCGGDCPVDSLLWWGALQYANARSRAEGLPECYALEGCYGGGAPKPFACTGVTVNAEDGNPYDCAGYRLPTEAEWEYACRAGTTTDYYSGPMREEACQLDANLDRIGWYCGNAGARTHPVGEKEPNDWGLYDMSGNVWEWVWDGTADPWDDYPLGPATDPIQFDEDGPFRIARGGSWNFGAERARCADRYLVPPVRRTSDQGFRLARTAP